MRVRMWEVRAADEIAAHVLTDWLLEVGIPAAALQPGYERAEVFRGAEDRIVVLTWWTGDTGELPEPPGDLMARPPHAWDFSSVACG